MTTWTPGLTFAAIVAGLCLLIAFVAVWLAWRYYHALDVSRREHRMADESRQYWREQHHAAKQDNHRLAVEARNLAEAAETWQRAYEQAASTVDEEVTA